MAKRTITVRGIPDPILKSLRRVAGENRRSLNAELLTILESATRAAGADGEPGDTAATAKGRAGGPLVDGLHRGTVAALCRKHHIAWLALFGSHARGDARADSDVDVAVEFEPGCTPGLGIVTVAESFAALVGGRRVDLVTLKGLPSGIRERVLASAVELYGAR